MSIEAASSPRSAFEKFMYFVAIANPLMTLPQIYKIWDGQSAEDVSLVTWCGYACSAICWILYSFAHREWALLVNNCIWLVLEIAVITGVLIHS